MWVRVCVGVSVCVCECVCKGAVGVCLCLCVFVFLGVCVGLFVYLFEGGWPELVSQMPQPWLLSWADMFQGDAFSACLLSVSALWVFLVILCFS